MKFRYALYFCAVLLCVHCSSQKGTERDGIIDWSCKATSSESILYLQQLGCAGDWALLEGKPLTSAHGQASTVKFVYSLRSGSIFFVNSNKYSLHREFVMANLDPTAAEIANWNVSQYRENENRTYVLGTVNHYQDAGVYSLQLFPGDDLNAEKLKKVFDSIRINAWFGDSLAFLPMSDLASSRAEAVHIPTISVDALQAGTLFQPMNPGEAFGTLIRATIGSVENAPLGRHDIVLTNGLPNSFPVVAGVITTVFQTPLSHINVLSKNRRTPNMVLRDGWQDPRLLALEGKLIHLVVTSDSFSVEAATPERAQAFWDSTGPGSPPELPLDSNPALLSVSELGLAMIPRVGAKAANFGELARIATQNNSPWKVPEGGFAIPFVHFLNHMKRHGLDRLADSLIRDSAFLSDAKARRNALASLRAEIIAAALDSNLLLEVEERVNKSGYTRMRFRSSTNAEDIAGFNGAGLYSSYTGILADSEKPISMAIKKVWASLWNDRAFEERSYFRIDQKKVAMGVLIHRGFPDEGANGVAFTYNLYDPSYFGYIINVQINDVSVVTPPPGVQCEQLIYYPFGQGIVGEPSIDLISKSSLTDGEPVLSVQEIIHLGNALKEVEIHYLGKPMDVEFKLDGVERTLYLKQARPAP